MYEFLRRLSTSVTRPFTRFQQKIAFLTGFILVFQMFAGFSTRQWDFSVYYAAAYAASEGVNPYSKEALRQLADSTDGLSYAGLPFLYPPVIARLFYPLTLLDHFNASFVWLLLKCAALEGMVWAILWLMGVKPSVLSVVLVNAFAVFFRPVRLDFNAGNIAVFEAFFLYLYYALLKNGKSVQSAGCLLAAGAAKITPLLLAVYPIHTRNTRFIYSFVSLGAVIGVMNLGDYRLFGQFFGFYRSNEWRLMWDELVQSFFNCSYVTVILRTFSDTYFSQPIFRSDILVAVLIPVFPILAFAGCAWVIRKHQSFAKREPYDVKIVCLVTCTFLLLLPRLAGYTLSWLLLPFVHLVHYAVQKKDYFVAVITMGSFCLLQHDIPPEHVTPGFSQLLIDKEFFGLLGVFITYIYVFCRENEVE